MGGVEIEGPKMTPKGPDDWDIAGRVGFRNVANDVGPILGHLGVLVFQGSVGVMKH